jgi:DNA-binding Lrp family transcriptional regulator
MAETPPRPRPLDGTDHALIDLLRANSRRAVADLADRAHISRASAYRRLRRLEDDGVILGYTVRTDPVALGLPLAAVILVSCDQGSWRTARTKLERLPGLEHLAATTGSFDFVLRVRVADTDTLRDVVLEDLHAITEVRATQTLFVLDEVDRAAARPHPRRF